MKIKSVFQHNNLVLEYSVCGEGEKVLFAFHGFGQSAETLLPVFEHSTQYTVYAFNLFHHGGSVFPKERMHHISLQPDELKRFFTEFTRKVGIDRFDLFGFSLGGKFALQLVNLFPNRIDQAVLAAPDGLKINPWYHFAARSTPGRMIFRFLLRHPGIFEFLLGVVRSLNIPSKSVSEFVYASLNTQEKREFVRDVWFIYKDIAVNTGQCAEKIKQNNIRVFQYYGKYDHIISSQHGVDFAQLINQPGRVTMLNAGHNLLSKRARLLLSRELGKSIGL